MRYDDLFGTLKVNSKNEENTFRHLFACYFGDIPANFYRNQFDLAVQYEGTDSEDWCRFLQHPPFDAWKSNQIAIIANTSTDQALAGSGLRDKESVNLLQVRKNILASENNNDKQTIIVMPESLFFKEGD